MPSGWNNYSLLTTYLKHYRVEEESIDICNGTISDSSLYDVQTTIKCQIVLACLLPTFIGECQRIA